MKAVVLIFRIPIFFLTSIWGFLFGIIVPIFLSNPNNFPEELATHPVMKFWVVFALIGYIIPCVLNSLKYFKWSAAFSILGTLLMLIMHSILIKFEEFDGGFFYLPQIFVTILAVILAVIINWKTMMIKHSEKEIDRNKTAGSILKSKKDV